MDNHTATEIAYKNGYEQGKKDAVKRGQWGEWTYAYNEVMYQRPCSECGRLSVEQGMYCTHCGAKMFDVR